MNKYDEWIASYKYNSTVGMCGKATEEMCRVFPELTRVPGHVYTMRGRLEHWWCVAPDGSIVDPTYSQFKGGVLQYELVRAEDEVRLGKCMNCGAEVYGPFSVGRRSMCLPLLYLQALDDYRYKSRAFPDIEDPKSWGGQHERSECEEEFIAWQEGRGGPSSTYNK